MGVCRGGVPDDDCGFGEESEKVAGNIGAALYVDEVFERVDVDVEGTVGVWPDLPGDVDGGAAAGMGVKLGAEKSATKVEGEGLTAAGAEGLFVRAEAGCCALVCEEGSD